jgi:hypothetical protein
VPFQSNVPAARCSTVTMLGFGLLIMTPVEHY